MQEKSTRILDLYFTSSPSPQNALDIFKNEWSSKLPNDLEKFKAGNSQLFDDDRIKWLISELGDVKDKTILELGPLEGGHTYMLEKNGAAILAIEGNSKAFLKCLITKELLGLKKSRFLCGNFTEYLKTSKEKFDVCIASGVLYHMINPIELLYLLSKTTNNLFIWTHYYDDEIISKNKEIKQKFTKGISTEHNGFRCSLFKYHYYDALSWNGFCGGPELYSYWMTRNDILKCLTFFGFTKIKTQFDHVDHINGPSLAILATKN